MNWTWIDNFHSKFTHIPRKLDRNYQKTRHSVRAVNLGQFGGVKVLHVTLTLLKKQRRKNSSLVSLPVEIPFCCEVFHSFVKSESALKCVEISAVNCLVIMNIWCALLRFPINYAKGLSTLTTYTECHKYTNQISIAFCADSVYSHENNVIRRPHCSILDCNQIPLEFIVHMSVALYRLKNSLIAFVLRIPHVLRILKMCFMDFLSHHFPIGLSTVFKHMCVDSSNAFIGGR